jgi:hypothetical protein
MIRCPACTFENASGIKFCGECGAALKLKCVRCGFENALGIKFCGECGQHLADSPSPAPLPKPRTYTPKHLAERILAEQAAMESRGAQDGERKTITALFADIKGSIEMMEGLDPEEARAIVDPALQLMMDAVHRYEAASTRRTTSCRGRASWSSARTADRLEIAEVAESDALALTLRRGGPSPWHPAPSQ